MSNGLSIIATLPDVLTICRTWMADRVLIRVEFRFRIFAATFRARVAAVSETQLSLISDDKLAELTLPIPTGVTFRFLDMRGFPQERDFERMIVMFYPFDPDPDKSDQIVLAEVAEHGE